MLSQYFPAWFIFYPVWYCSLWINQALLVVKILSITLLTTVYWKNKNWSKRVGEKWDLGRLSRKNVTAILVWKKGEINYLDGRKIYTSIRYHSRFFVRVGHERTIVPSGNIIFSLYHVIIRLTKIIKDLLKDRKILIFKVFF